MSLQSTVPCFLTFYNSDQSLATPLLKTKILLEIIFNYSLWDLATLLYIVFCIYHHLHP